MDTDLFARVFVTMVVILDPIGNAPVFLALTRTRPAERGRVAIQATLFAGAVILAFALFGEQVLELLSISVEALQVSGGLVLVLVALELLSGQGRGTLDAGDSSSVLVPLGTPLLAGPAAVAATMFFIREVDGSEEVVAVSAALVGALVAVYLGLRFASVLARVLKDSGIELLSRIVGVILGAIAVQLIAEGIERWVREGVG